MLCLSNINCFVLYSLHIFTINLLYCYISIWNMVYYFINIYLKNFKVNLKKFCLNRRPPLIFVMVLSTLWLGFPLRLVFQSQTEALSLLLPPSCRGHRKQQSPFCCSAESRPVRQGNRQCALRLSNVLQYHHLMMGKIKTTAIRKWSNKEVNMMTCATILLRLNYV